MQIFDENIRQTILDTRFSIWSGFLRDLERTAEPDHTVVRFPNSSTYIFSTGRKTFWMMDPNFNMTGFDEQELDGITALIAQKIRFIVITHLHGDHCQAQLVRKLKDSPIRWIISPRFTEYFTTNFGVAPDRLIELADGEETQIEAIRIRAQRGYHAEPGKKVVVSCSYDITLPDGVRLFFPADIRDYEAEIPDREQPVDYIFGHVFLGREDAQGDQFSMLDGFCRFMTSRKSSNLILTHLYEVSRQPRDLWTRRHAEMAAEAIRKYDPELKIVIPHFGDMLHLVRETGKYADPFASWSESERQEFLSQFGMAVKKDHVQWMERAIAEKIPVVEWNFNPFRAADPAARAEQVVRWRAAGGTCLSLHFPNLPVDPNPDAEANIAIAIEAARENHMDRITIHVPDFPVGQTEQRLDAVAERFISMLHPLLDAGIRIGIENLHMKPRYTPDETRPFGFIPEECLLLVNTLRQKTGSDLWGCHLDIGHAYSNYPYSRVNDTARWLELCGPLLNGLHIHQFEHAVSAEEPYLEGHSHLTGRTMGHPSLLPVFDAWHRGIFRAPMILEIMRREEAEPFSSLARIRNLKS